MNEAKEASLKLGGEALAALAQVAQERGTTLSDALGRAIAVDAFIHRQQKGGAAFLITRDYGKTFEKVHFDGS